MVETESCITGCTIASEYAAWLPNIALVILSVFLILATLYMISRALGRKEWEALVKTEVTQTIAALIWVVIITVFAATACSVSCAVTKDVNPFTTALEYLSNIKGTLESYMNQMISIAKEIRIKSAVMYWLPKVTLRPWSGCDMIAGNFEMMGTLLAPFVGSLIVQQYALALVSNLAFAVLLPIGVVLRLIPFARELGSALIALAIALYIILPLTYVFAKKAMDTVPIPSISLEGPGSNCVAPGKTQEIFETVGWTLPQAVFFPALSFIITAACARALSKVFMYDFQEML